MSSFFFVGTTFLFGTSVVGTTKAKDSANEVPNNSQLSFIWNLSFKIAESFTFVVPTTEVPNTNFVYFYFEILVGSNYFCGLNYLIEENYSLH